MPGRLRVALAWTCALALTACAPAAASTHGATGAARTVAATPATAAVARTTAPIGSVVAPTPTAAAPATDWHRPAADAPWLVTLNAYRALAGAPPVAEDPEQSADCLAHARYTVAAGVLDHSEDPQSPAHTAAGDRGVRESNVGAGNGQQARTARDEIESFVGSVFHALGPLSPRLRTAGYGFSTGSGDGTYTWGSCLNVLRGPRPSSATEPAPWRSAATSSTRASLPSTLQTSNSRIG